jgi:hypothetical protein
MCSDKHIKAVSGHSKIDITPPSPQQGRSLMLCSFNSGRRGFTKANRPIELVRATARAFG